MSLRGYHRGVEETVGGPAEAMHKMRVLQCSTSSGKLEKEVVGCLPGCM